MCTLVGLALVGVIQLAMQFGLRRWDIRGLLPLAALPHVAGLALFSWRGFGLIRRHFTDTFNRLLPWDAALAMLLGIAMISMSWAYGPQWLGRSAGDAPMTYSVLLVMGVPINARDSAGYSALIYAARVDDVQAMQSLIDSGADLDPSDTWGTPMTHAAARGHCRAVQLLLDRGADATSVNRNGLTPEQLAVKHGHPEVAALIHNAHGPSEE